MKLSIVIPTLNEEEGIAVTMDAIDRNAIKSAGWDLEILVIDGNSKDKTKEVAEARGAIVITEPRRGYGRAYKTGFGAATGDIIATGDADGTYPFERVHEYVQQLLDSGTAFLTCDRYADLGEGSMSAKHKLGNWVLSQTARTLYRVRLRDSQSGMWVFHRDALSRIPIDALSDGMAFSQEIKIEAMQRLGDAALEVPASLRARVGEPVIASWRDGFGNLWALAKGRVKKRA